MLSLAQEYVVAAIGELASTTGRLGRGAEPVAFG